MNAPSLTTSLVVHDDGRAEEDVRPAVVVAGVGVQEAVIVGEVGRRLQSLCFLQSNHGTALTVSQNDMTSTSESQYVIDNPMSLTTQRH